MLQQSQHYNLLMEKHFLTLQPTQMLRPGQILEHKDFGQKSQDAYFDVRIFHLNTPSYVSKPLSALFRTHGREATTFYKRLADLLSEKQDKAYSLAEMSSVFCHTAHCYHVPARKQVFLPPPSLL